MVAALPGKLWIGNDVHGSGLFLDLAERYRGAKGKGLSRATGESSNGSSSNDGDREVGRRRQARWVVLTIGKLIR